MARCFLLMGKWASASEAADVVLSKDKTFVKALLVKAEALYNTCDFEHSLVLFHRGQVRRSTESNDGFKGGNLMELGEQACVRACSLYHTLSILTSP
jgi:hypothetical protein